ncbi:hypothetical protein [Mycoplasmoides fastidiosum]|uniref:hypothetical protein n=1 Tax=Mycoplasmoides fastidiosum TaxID=92758 RepID=UPI0021149B5E|nr:hypothetical protein [Mycoplasmoides fastidiosum]UUD38115.1 hypothetical protein NPA10_01885 [Mycoplasmoides fastidiosum]
MLWKNLKEIFEANSLEEEFPFRKAISDQIKEEKNFNFVNNNGLMINFKTPSSKNRISVVNKIRHYDKKSKNSIEILKLKNSNSFYESFDWLWIDVYKYEIDNQIHYLPVPANCNTIMIYNKKQNNENIKLERNLEKEKINNYFRNYFNLSNFNLPDIKQNKQIDYKSGYFYYVQNRLKKESDKIKEIKNFTFFHRIFRNSIILHNTYFEDGKKNIDSAAYFVGFKQSNSSLEIKKLEYHATNKNKRIRKSLQNLMKDGYVYFADLDVLGNIFNIKEIE